MKKLYFFYADWCPACKFYRKMVIKPLEEKIGSQRVCQINVQEKPFEADKYLIEKLPSVVIVEDGQVILSQYGSLTAERLEKLLI